MTHPPFSLLLPVYAGDHPEHLLNAFKSSTESQTVAPTEAVIVQDGPVSPEIEAILERLRESSSVPTRIVRLPVNAGLAYALEQGLTECRHDLIARIDADDLSLPSRFERQLEGMSTGLDLIGTGMYEFIDEVGSIVGRRVPPSGPAAIARYARFHDPFNHPTVMYRRSAVRKAGGYLPIGLMEDYYLFARMIQSGARVDNLIDPLVMYRVGEGAYARRGGAAQLRAELQLQRQFRRVGFTTRAQAIRNVAVRGAYRLVPEAVRRIAYRRLIAPGRFGRRSD